MSRNTTDRSSDGKINATRALFGPIGLVLLTGAISLLASSIQGDYAAYSRATHVTTNVLRDLNRLGPSLCLRYSSSGDESRPMPEMRKQMPDVSIRQIAVWEKARTELDWIGYIDGDLNTVTARLASIVGRLAAATPAQQEGLFVRFGVTRYRGPRREEEVFLASPRTGEIIFIDGVSVKLELANMRRDDDRSAIAFDYRVVVESQWGSYEQEGPAETSTPSEAAALASIVDGALLTLTMNDLFVVGPTGATRMLAHAVYARWYLVLLVVGFAAGACAYRAIKRRERLWGVRMSIHGTVAIALVAFVPLVDFMTRLLAPIDIRWIESGRCEVVVIVALSALAILYARATWRLVVPGPQIVNPG